MITLPPQPNVKDFTDNKGFIYHVSFNDALRSWELICLAIINKEKKENK